jgi:hypothetical protein
MAAQHGDGGSGIPTAASSWEEKTLDLLNAKFIEDNVTPFNIVTPFNVDERLQLPVELQMRT